MTSTKQMKRLLLVALSSCVVLLLLPTAALALNKNVGEMKGQVYYDPPVGANKPLKGVQVQLITQLGGSKVGEPSITDANGNYSLLGFANGSFEYKVRLLPPAPYKILTPAGGEYVKLKPASEGVIGNLNFSVEGATITGAVFQDLDGDGIKNGSDKDLEGATVKAVGLGGVEVEATTLANGTFKTEPPLLPAGSVTVTASKGEYEATTPAGKPSPAAGTTVALGQPLGLHFATGTIEGDAYAEANGTSGRQAGEPPIAGVGIAVKGTYDGKSFELKTTTAADGTFSLPGVFAGTSRTISATQPAAYADGEEFTSAIGATPGADQFTTVTVTKNTATGRFQFGETGSTISGLTFSDCNANGLSDAGETPLGSRGIVVTTPGFEQTTVTSGGDGVFSVKGLPGGGNVTLTPVTTSDATAPPAKIAQPTVGGTVASLPFGYVVPGDCKGPGGKEGGKEGDKKDEKAEKVSIVSGKKTTVKKSKLSLTCELDKGSVKSCVFTIQSKAKKGKKGKVLARGKATAAGPGTSLKVTLKLTKLGKAKLELSPKLLRGVAQVVAVDSTGQTLKASKSVKLKRR